VLRFLAIWIVLSAVVVLLLSLLGPVARLEFAAMVLASLVATVLIVRRWPPEASRSTER
jgi:membrane protein implicated in regulation of membrane protease activity